MSTYSNRIRDNQRRSRAKKMGYIEYLQAAPEKANEEKQKRIDEKQHLHLLLGQYGHSPNDMSNDDVSPTPKLEDVRGCDAGKQAQPRNLLQGSQIDQIPDIKHINIATEPKLLDLWPVAQETSFHHTERALQRAYGLGISPTQLEIPQQMDKFSNTYTQSLSDDKYMQKTYRLDSFLTQIPWDDEAFQQMDEFNSNCTQSLSDDKSIQETCGLSSCPTQLQMPLDDEASRQMPLIQPNLALASAKPQLILQQALGRNVLPGPCRPKKTRKPRKFLTIEEKQQICQTAQETPSLKRVEIADMFYITKSTLFNILKESKNNEGYTQQRVHIQCPFCPNRSKEPRSFREHIKLHNRSGAEGNRNKVVFAKGAADVLQSLREGRFICQPL